MRLSVGIIKPFKQGGRPKMAIAGKGVKGKEALHVFLNFERGLSFRDTPSCI